MTGKRAARLEGKEKLLLSSTGVGDRAKQVIPVWSTGVWFNTMQRHVKHSQITEAFCKSMERGAPEAGHAPVFARTPTLTYTVIVCEKTHWQLDRLLCFR
jgi:hypothetical protein